MDQQQVVRLLLIASVLLVGASIPVAAQSSTDTPPDPAATKADYENMLGNLYTVAHTTLKYAGFVTAFFGSVLWFSARRNSDRAQTGIWLLVGGLVMIVFYFGFTGFVALLKWIAQGA
jgi:hypothetical protein